MTFTWRRGAAYLLIRYERTVREALRNPIQVLSSLTEKSKNESYRFQRLYRNLYNPEFYWLAYKTYMQTQAVWLPVQMELPLMAWVTKESKGLLNPCEIKVTCQNLHAGNILLRKTAIKAPVGNPVGQWQTGAGSSENDFRKHLWACV